MAGTRVVIRKGNEGPAPVIFYINGKEHKVRGEYDVKTTLNDYIRGVAGLTGTKIMCNEGGCGCCAVTVRQNDHVTGQDRSFSINSCLCPLYSVNGWQITTVEGIGSRKDGYHPIQDRIAKYNGSQCGYCTPGMVMNMYGLLHQNRTPTQEFVEDQFGGNICRCTGYRPILDSMKSFATDSTLPGAKCIDIEDLNKKICPRSGMVCKEDGQPVCVGNKMWYRPTTFKDLCAIVKQNQKKRIRLVFANTSTGVFKHEGPFDVYIDLHNMKELYQFQGNKALKGAKCSVKRSGLHGMEFGANMSLTDLIQTLEQHRSEKGYVYFGVIARHLLRIGNVLLRNACSWAGNVMVKHNYPDFPSDVFTSLEAAGAHINVMDLTNGSVQNYPLLSLVTELNMKNKLIVSLELYQQDQTFRMQSYKIMPRAQNTHAYVNAGYSFSVDPNFKVLNKPSLVIGGINKNMVHATKTETYLQGKVLTDQSVVKTALETLATELQPTSEHVLASPQYRRNLAVNLLYKTILGICGAKQQTRVSGPLPIERPVSRGIREFKENKADFPLKEAMPKLAAHAQATGEAEFINDMPTATNELYGAFVITSKGPATLENVDPSEVLKLPGVVDYISVKDIPKGGMNNTIPTIMYTVFAPEELFCSGKVLYAGQQVGLILAESQAIADQAAEKVKISYKDVQPPILTIEQAVERGSFHANPMAEHKVGDPENALKTSPKKLSGECRWGSNYHFYMENQVSRCVPSEERMDVYAATQSGEITQGLVAMVTTLPVNNVNVTIPRIGGSFGGKFLTSLPTTAATAVAAYKHNRPVRVSVNMSTNMKMAGKRFPILAKYDVGFDEDGRVNVVSIDVYCDGGSSPNSMFAFGEICSMIDQGYYVPNWRIKVIACKTDKPANTAMRAPGPLPASYMIESVMEHVAKYINRNVVDVKEINLYKKGQIDLKGHELTYCTIRKLWTELRRWAEVDRRQDEINSFNKANQWKKRALTMTPAKYGMHYQGGGMVVDVAIYPRDGTVSVSHGGIEMGQGLSTKVAQAVAMSLGVPISAVKTLPANTHTTANSFPTGGSVGSEFVAMCITWDTEIPGMTAGNGMSALRCCEILNERMKPIREKNPDHDWMNLLKTCDMAGIELTAKNKTAPRKKDGPGEFQYFTYCAGVTEVELDVLTGENQVRRVDILFDCGESLNPDIDIGQIEGSYVMGMGNFLLEKVIYDPETGVVLNDGTWEYKAPTPKDIPVDFRIRLLPDAPNPVGVRGSKASGEPPILLATGAFYALKQAMETARAELIGNNEFVTPDAPLTVEQLMLGCGVKVDKLVL